MFYPFSASKRETKYAQTHTSAILRRWGRVPSFILKGGTRTHCDHFVARHSGGAETSLLANDVPGRDTVAPVCTRDGLRSVDGKKGWVFGRRLQDVLLNDASFFLSFLPTPGLISAAPQPRWSRASNLQDLRTFIPRSWSRSGDKTTDRNSYPNYPTVVFQHFPTHRFTLCLFNGEGSLLFGSLTPHQVDRRSGFPLTNNGEFFPTAPPLRLGGYS